MTNIQPIIFSGFTSETSGPGENLRSLGAMIEIIKLPSTVKILPTIYKPYSVLPSSIEEFISLATINDFLILGGHSYGFGAVKYLVDRFKSRGFAGHVLCSFGLDGVPDAFRFQQLFNSLVSDSDPSLRWGIDATVSPIAFQIYQRNQLIPQGVQLRELSPLDTGPFAGLLPSHWNILADEIAFTKINHSTVATDAVIWTYVKNQVQKSIIEQLKL